MSAAQAEGSLAMDQGEAIAAAACMLAMAEPAIDPDGSLATALWPWPGPLPPVLGRREALIAARGYIDMQLGLE